MKVKVDKPEKPGDILYTVVSITNDKRSIISVATANPWTFLAISWAKADVTSDLQFWAVDVLSPWSILFFLTIIYSYLVM